MKESRSVMEFKDCATCLIFEVLMLHKNSYYFPYFLFVLHTVWGSWNCWNGDFIWWESIYIVVCLFDAFDVILVFLSPCIIVYFGDEGSCGHLLLNYDWGCNVFACVLKLFLFLISWISKWQKGVISVSYVNMCGCPYMHIIFVNDWLLMRVLLCLK